MPNNQLTLSIDCSKIAVGVYTHRYSFTDVLTSLEDWLEENKKWEQVEFLLTFDYPNIEEMQLYKIRDNGEDVKPIMIDAHLPGKKITDAFFEKLKDASFSEELQMEEIAVILLEDLLS